MYADESNVFKQVFVQFLKLSVDNNVGKTKMSTTNVIFSMFRYESFVCLLFDYRIFYEKKTVPLIYLKLDFNVRVCASQQQQGQFLFISFVEHIITSKI